VNLARPLAISQLVEDDLPDAEGMLMRAFGAPAGVFGRRLRRYLALNPRTWLALRTAGSPSLLGLVGANLFEGCAYIGLMGIEPSAQRQGHGERLMRALIERLAGEGVHTLMLDASAAGAPLYAKLGFVTVGHAGEWHRADLPPGDTSGPRPGRPLDADARTGRGNTDHGAGVVEISGPDGYHQVAALDARFFGFDRTRLWTRLAQEGPAIRTFVVADETSRMTGYLCLQNGLLAGPFGATTPGAAQVLLQAVLGRDASFLRGGRVLVPSHNADAPVVLRRAGFQEIRQLTHMRLVLPEAPASPAEQTPSWSRIYGKGSFCLG
jgi:GNAT superfamily N-acetyltransferase